MDRWSQSETKLALSWTLHFLKAQQVDTRALERELRKKHGSLSASSSSLSTLTAAMGFNLNVLAVDDDDEEDYEDEEYDESPVRPRRVRVREQGKENRAAAAKKGGNKKKVSKKKVQKKKKGSSGPPLGKAEPPAGRRGKHETQSGNFKAKHEIKRTPPTASLAQRLGGLSLSMSSDEESDASSVGSLESKSQCSSPGAPLTPNDGLQGLF